jgi:hypothetical protein
LVRNVPPENTLRESVLVPLGVAGREHHERQRSEKWHDPSSFHGYCSEE